MEQKRRDGDPQHFDFAERVVGADDPVSSSAILDGSSVQCRTAATNADNSGLWKGSVFSGFFESADFVWMGKKIICTPMCEYL